MPVERRQWLALMLGGAGLVLLVATLPRFHGTHSQFSLAAIVSFEGGLVLLAGALALGHRSERLPPRRGVLRAVLAGTPLRPRRDRDQGPHRWRRQPGPDPRP